MTHLPLADPGAPPLDQLARLFHALSDPTRLRILEMLRAGEHCVCDLTGALDAQQSRLSFHLRTLKEAGLVTDRREGRWSFYALRPQALDLMEDLLGRYRVPCQPAEALCCVRAGREQKAES